MRNLEEKGIGMERKSMCQTDSLTTYLHTSGNDMVA
jgi:hypothetical protein